MAQQIKGITIEFRGDTTKLDKALRSVRNDSKSIDSELQKVNKSLKFNPKNTQLLAQKQTLLKEKIAATNKSLGELKKIQNQMDAKGVNKNSAEYRALQREIIETESKLKHFESEYRKLGNPKLNALKQELNDLSAKFKTAGESLTKYVTGPIAALGAASGVAFNSVDGALKNLVQLTGASGEDLAGMEEIVKRIATTTPSDFDTISKSVGEVNTRFGLTGDQLDKVSEAFVQFAEVNGTDVVTSIDQTQKAMSQFGIDAEDAGDVLDLLTKVSQDTGVSVERLTQGLISNGTAFQEMGLDINQSATLMGMFEKSGVSMETVTNGMRRAMKNAAAEGKDVNEALLELQEAIEGGVDETTALNMAYDLFGKSGDQIYGAVKSGAVDFRELAAASTDAEGALSDTFARTQTPADKFQVVLNRLKLLGYEIANSVMPVIEPAIQKIADGVGRLAEKWNSLPQGTQQKIIAVAAALAAIGPVLLIISKGLALVSAAIGVAQTVVGGLSTALSFLAANPVVLIIAGLAALVTAFVLLWKKSESFRNFFINLWNNIKTKITAILTTIKTAFSNAWTAIKNVWNGVGTFFTAKWNSIKTTFSNVKSYLSGKFGDAWKAIKEKFSKWGEFWGGLWTTVKEKFSAIGTSIGNAISGAVKGGINGIISSIESVINSGIGLINGAINLINKLPGVSVGKIGTLSLPRLAQGGIVDSATLALIGEGSSSEAVIPLDELWKRMDKLTASLGQTGGQPIVLNVYGSDGMNVNDLADKVIQKLITEQKRRRVAWQ